MPAPTSSREQFFNQLKRKHPNIYAVYLMVSIVSIWSGSWYIADTWATGKELLAAGTVVGPAVVSRHLFLLLVGLAMLYADDRSLEELVLMKTSPLKKTYRKGIRGFFSYVKRRYPNLIAIYTYLGIILAWCGTWGLLWDIPIHPLLRSLLTIGSGFFMLYVDDLKLTEI